MADDLTIENARTTLARDASDVQIVNLPVTNSTTSRLYVWATPRAITYDPASLTLSVRLAENPVPLSDHLDVISHHPRLPAEIVLEPGESTQLQIRVPPILNTVDLDSPREGLGLPMSQIEVGEIAQVSVSIAASSTPFADVTDSPLDSMVEQLRSGPGISTATVTASPLTNDPKGNS